MKVGKPKSKRVPVRLRHKIQKASAAKERKSRKEAKKNPQWRSRLKKDPGIPNLFPYKDKVLAEIEEGRRRKEEEAQKRKEIAKAQREGRAVADVSANPIEVMEEDGDDQLVDSEDVDDEEVEMDERADGNPMAALLASAQARAQAYSGIEERPDEPEAEGDEWTGLEESDAKFTTRQTQPERKALPKQALADPVKAVSALLERLQNTQDGVQQLIDHYQLPALATGNSGTTSRFLVEVARRRGRLGRGGVPNLHAAALAVLGDLNDGRLSLPALSTPLASTSGLASKGEVQIVSQLAEPFRIEGLFGDKQPSARVADMEVEAV